MAMRIRRSSLSDQVSDAIVSLIEEREIDVGAPLPPTGELATTFGVSVVVVREALAALAGRGIVQRGQGREPVVARPGGPVLDSIFRTRMRQDGISVDEFQHCRAALENQSALEAALQPNHAEARIVLGSLVDRLEAATTVDEMIAADLEFHAALARFSGNRALPIVLEGLNTFVRDSLVTMYDRMGVHRVQAIQEIVSNHRDIVSSVAAGDPAAAVAAMRRHFQASSPHLKFTFGDG